jgi:hypothetical protein
MTPNPESAAAAVGELHAQLSMIDGAVESLNTRAALLPAALAGIAGIFIAPDSRFSAGQIIFLLIALATGVASVAIALWVLRARYVSSGPNAQTMIAGTHLAPADFNRAVAGSLAIAVDKMSEVTKWKGDAINRAMWLAAVSVVFLAIARVAGGQP